MMSIQGKESDTFEKAASAILAVQLDGQVGGAAKQVSSFILASPLPHNSGCRQRQMKLANFRSFIRHSNITSNCVTFLKSFRYSVIYFVKGVNCLINSGHQMSF
jgi:hypothetical protein